MKKKRLNLCISLITALIACNICIDSYAQDKASGGGGGGGGGIGNSNADAQFRELYPRALAGEPNAMFSLGKIYLEGTSSAGKESAKGMDFIQKASSAGNVAATKYMIDAYERSGSERALELCQKLQKAGDKYCDKKMETLVERSIPKTVSASNCKKLNDLYNGGNQGPVVKSEVTACVLQGLSSTISFDQAMSNLRVQAADDPKAFARLMGFMLKAGTPEWDPVFVEEYLPKAGLTFKDKEVKELFLKNDITFDGCRKMDRLRRENLRQRPSVCRMAAKSGDEDAALYVGDAYLAGKNYFPEDAAEASFYIKEASLSKNPIISSEAFVLLMDLYKKQGKFYEHFSTVKHEIKVNSLNKTAAFASFGFEADYLVKNHSSMALEDILDLVATADNKDIDQSIKSRIGRTVDEVIKDRGRLMRPIEKDSMLAYKDRLLSQKDKDEIEGARLAMQSQVTAGKAETPRAEVPRVADSDKRSSEKEPSFIDKVLNRSAP